MRVVLKLENVYVTAYWVRLEKNGNICGWASSLFSEFFSKPNTENLDFHFYYPVDGNYHNTFKYKNSHDGTTIEERYYWDKKVTKILDSSKSPIDVIHEEYADPDLTIGFRPFVERPPTLDSIGMNMTISSFTGTFDSNYSKLFDSIRKTSLKDDEIIIDLNQKPSSHFLIASSFYSKEHTQCICDLVAESMGDKFVSTQRMRVENDRLYLELYVVYFNA